MQRPDQSSLSQPQHAVAERPDTGENDFVGDEDDLWIGSQLNLDAYYCEAAPEDTLAYTDYGGRYASVIASGHLYGVQFHPEKSQRVGLAILRNFVEHCR